METTSPAGVPATDESRGSGEVLEYRQRRAELLRGTIEHREFDVGMECRELDDGTFRMTGVASSTERFYDVGDPQRGGFRERISRGAFRRTLNDNPDVVLLGNHEGWPLARTRNGSLTLAETPRGLQWDADLDAEDQESKSIARKVERGLVDQCSFAFLATDDEWNDDYTERTIKGVSLHRGDVSIVTYGANEATSVEAVRAFTDQLEQRASKQLSAQSREELEAIRDSIDSFLSSKDQPADPEDNEPESEDEDESEAQDAEEPELVRSVVRHDYTMREKERLAILRRSA